ncbi:molybdate ABC transporter substrate-binding protein [Halobacillus litoralis]|uniref:Molybdate ABC transporter substrate-binding protein n=1 Tax=Halobacillus litoralis TaxID=45668 RepID=A0A845DW59_9BACI|nr:MULTISPECIES: molybdate ABC transporter substrate-binding protein [Halobacillus]MYL20725.1 molybdate ABC transporter substrate-binding protein [Halobacillus litoralis]MYL29815.1 molybdate ABC transporter substrate-binding protein [Halobacillus halophilus]
MKKRIWAAFVFLLFSAGCAGAEEKPTLTIAAAASLTDAMEEIVPQYEDTSNVNVTLLLGSSGKLARQIEQGAPVDVFLSADTRWTTYLKERALTDDDQTTTFAENQLVIISHEEQPSINSLKALDSMAGDQTLAVGNPDSVPAGTYTKQALETIQLWDRLQEQMVFAGDVRQVLTYVESGDADYGVVYATDALISDKVHVTAEVDPALHDSIIYPAAAITKSRTEDAASSFLTFLSTEKAVSILENNGFTTLGDEKNR